MIFAPAERRSKNKRNPRNPGFIYGVETQVRQRPRCQVSNRRRGEDESDDAEGERRVQENEIETHRYVGSIVAQTQNMSLTARETHSYLL